MHLKHFSCCFELFVNIHLLQASNNFSVSLQLKNKERDHIAQITDEWKTQVKAQTIELDRRMGECKILTESLSNAKQDLRNRIKTCSTREQEVRMDYSPHKFYVK